MYEVFTNICPNNYLNINKYDIYIYIYGIMSYIIIYLYYSILIYIPQELDRQQKKNTIDSQQSVILTESSSKFHCGRRPQMPLGFVGCGAPVAFAAREKCHAGSVTPRNHQFLTGFITPVWVSTLLSSSAVKHLKLWCALDTKPH